MILGIYKVSGHSMIPFFRPDDRVLVSSIVYSFKNPKINDVILFRQNGKVMIKRIKGIKDDKYIVEGDNKKDSLKINAILKKEILGKVILKI